MSSNAQAGPIAYLTGEYPKVSHTFIEREIAALRAGGREIAACTVRRPAPDQVVGPAQQAEARDTFCVLDQARSPLRLIGAHLRLLRRDPRAWGRALRLAWTTRAPGARAALWQGFYLLEAGVLADHLHRIGARHLHNHFANSSCSVAMLAAEMAGIGFSFTLHGPAIFFEPARWALGEKIARARFVSCISHFARSQAMYFSDPAMWDKLRIVHCGVTPDHYHRAGTEPVSRTEGPVVLFVGRLDPVKGAPLLIEAFARLRGTHPQARLSIVGDGPDRARLEAQVRALGLAPCTRFHGYLDSAQVAQEMARADLLVLPSFAEGVPVTLMEAMATGLAVIASRVAGVQELVEDGVSGRVLAPGDLDGLCGALDQLLSDPDLRARMGQAGRAMVLRQFDIASEAAWLGQLFDGACAGHLPPGLRPRLRD